MRAKFLTRILLILCIVPLFFLVACNREGDNGAVDTGADSVAAADARAQIHGHVRFADYSWNESPNHEEFLQRFMDMYPNITVERVWVPYDMANQLTAWAAAGDLPCVAIGWDYLPFYATQGWLHPLCDFVANDPDAQWMPEFYLEAFTFNGMLYAVPAYFQFNGVMINLDLLDQLNEDPPPFDWTIDEFLRLAHVATTTTTSGFTWSPISQYFTGQFDPDMGMRGFNTTTRRFEFSHPSWARTVNMDLELRAVPGLLSDWMSDEDHARKFGEGTDALGAGLVLMAPIATWNWSWARHMAFNFEIWPQPSDPSVGSRFPIHADFGFMLSTAQYPEAAYALLRYLTFSTEGTLSRLYMDNNFREYDDDGVFTGYATPHWILPSNGSPEVLAVIRQMGDDGIIPGGFIYQFENMATAGFIGDWQKWIPNFWPILEPFWSIFYDRVVPGEIAASAVAAELDEIINANLDREMAEFERIMADVQAEFAARQ